MTDNNNKNKITVTFAPGVLEDLEAQMSPEELQKFLDALTELQETGEIEKLYEAGDTVDMQKLEKEDPELYKTITTQLDGCFDESGQPPIIH